MEKQYFTLEELDSPLTLQEKDILALRLGLRNNEIYTFEAIGYLYGLTRERIRQIECKAFEKLDKAVVEANNKTIKKPHLTPLQQEILKRKFGLEGHRMHSDYAIDKELEVSVEEIHSAMIAALKPIRKNLNRVKI